MTSGATPGEIFVPRKPIGDATRQVTDGKTTREVQIIGRFGPEYEVFDIQNGGHGEIYFCVRASVPDPALAVVCKRFPRQVLLDPVRRRAFMRECLLAVRLSAFPGFVNSHVVRIDGLPILIAAAVLRGDDGVVNLRDVVEGPRLPAPVLGFLAWAVADSLAEADRVHPGLVHGDLKPENILVQAGAPLITDLGLASTLRHGWGHDVLPGTPRYLAPEARSSGAVLTRATDIYAFGVILRELLENCEAADLGPLAESFDLMTGLASQCNEDDSERRPVSFTEVAERLRRSFDESDPAVEKRYRVRQLFATLSASFSAIAPQVELESVARLEQWDLLHEMIESQPSESRTSSTWQLHGLALTRMGRDPEALDSFRTALACAEWEMETVGRPLIYNPGEDASRSIRFDIAVLLVNMGHSREAEELGRALVAEAESDDGARHATGIVALALIQSGQLAQGEQMLVTSMIGEHNNERLAEGFRARSELRLRQGRPDEAIEAMQRAVQLTPGRAAHHRRLGQLLAWLGQHHRAVAAFDHAMLAGDQTPGVLEMRLACAIAAEDKAPNAHREEAERLFGSARVDDAWPAVLNILANARELGPARADAPASRGPVARTLNFGELQVEIGDTGFYIFDYYTDGDEQDLVGEFSTQYREMSMMITSATLRGTPIVCTRCLGCGTEILTNRPVGAPLKCVRCEEANYVSPLLDNRYQDFYAAIGSLLNLVEEAADGQGRCVVIQPWDQASEEETTRVHEAARRHGLQPAPAHHAAVVFVYMQGLSDGMFAFNHEPIGAIYRFPPGSQHVPRMAPAPVEDYLMEVREIFACPVNSSSGHIDFTRTDPQGLIFANRLDEAAERARHDPNIPRRQATLVLLSQLRMIREQPEVALLHADEAVRLDGDNEDAWVAKGYAELTCCDAAAARESLRQALRVNSASSSVTALKAIIEHHSGDETARFTLDRAIALGALVPPPA